MKRFPLEIIRPTPEEVRQQVIDEIRSVVENLQHGQTIAIRRCAQGEDALFTVYTKGTVMLGNVGDAA